ncbi:MAG TPA: exo-alpha-sialidase [Tahibacter sp.]|nr:exo-alpha-sialidase [Tahibacter sp.]
MRLATLLFCLASPLAFAQQAVTGGAGLDYMPSVIRDADGTLRVAFERLNPSTLSGDLWTTHSNDGGATWSTPTVAVATTSNERHPALVPLADGSYVLFFLHGASAASSFRIHRATSPDGMAFSDLGAIALGWATGGEINPHVVRHPDGTLTMSYQRLGSGGSYVAQSTDGGATWDTLRTPIAADGLLPRIAFRASDGKYLATYQVGPSPLALYAKTTTNVRDWSAAPVDFATDGDNHDSLPVVMPDDAFAVFYIHADGSQYDVYSRRSTDGVAFEASLAHVVGDADDVEPHPLVGTSSQKVELYWGSAAAGSNDYDILRLVDVAVSEAIFDDGFDAP